MFFTSLGGAAAKNESGPQPGCGGRPVSANMALRPREREEFVVTCSGVGLILKDFPTRGLHYIIHGEYDETRSGPWTRGLLIRRKIADCDLPNVMSAAIGHDANVSTPPKTRPGSKNCCHGDDPLAGPENPPHCQSAGSTADRTSQGHPLVPLAKSPASPRSEWNCNARPPKPPAPPPDRPRPSIRPARRLGRSRPCRPRLVRPWR